MSGAVIGPDHWVLLEDWHNDDYGLFLDLGTHGTTRHVRLVDNSSRQKELNKEGNAGVKEIEKGEFLRRYYGFVAAGK